MIAEDAEDLRHPDRLVYAVSVRRIRLPLVSPYRLSYRTFTEFEPIVVALHDSDGHVGWGEGHISPGSSKETREGGWRFGAAQARALVGLPVSEARRLLLEHAHESPVAASALITALESLGGHRALHAPEPVRHHLLTPVSALARDEIAREVEALLGAGFTTFKVKVGKDVAADLARVRVIQEAAVGRAVLRIDANRAFDRAAGIAFASALDPAGIELFEQPCATEAWDDNAAVAAASRVPVMLDEPICGLDDISRAAAIPGVRFCKLKLKRFSGLGRLVAALDAVRGHGMGAVLGDGLGCDLSGWLEAMAGTGRIHGAGEFNGFLKLRTGLLANPLPVTSATLDIPPGFTPVPDPETLAAHTLEEIRYGETGAPVPVGA